MSKQKEKLEEIKKSLQQNREILMPVFGIMFWQLALAEARLTAEEFASEGMKLTLEKDDDEVVATFMATYIELWLSAKDFNAASRFIADGLGMSADELLQTRQLYQDQLSK
jgi:hypothetical protein